MNKGIVIEIHSSHVVLLLPSGEFVNGQKREGVISLGDEIVYQPLQRAVNKNRSKKVKAFVPVGAFLAAAAIMFLFFLPMFKTDAATMAYISVDINPSLEIEVDENGYVKSLKAYNQDGEFIIDQLDPNLGKVSTVMSSIIQKSKDAGFIKEDKSIIISPVYLSGIPTSLKESIMTNINRLKQEDMEVRVFIGSEEERSLALEKSKTVAMVNREELNQKANAVEPMPEEKISTPVVKEENVSNQEKEEQEVEEKSGNTSISEEPRQEDIEEKDDQSDEKNDEEKERKENRKEEKGKPGKKDLPEQARKGLEKAEEKRKDPSNGKGNGKKDKDKDDDDDDKEDRDDEEED